MRRTGAGMFHVGVLSPAAFAAGGNRLPVPNNIYNVETMIRVSPELFYSSFKTLASEYQPKLLQCWNSCPQYTALFRGKFLPDLAKCLNLCCYQKDYYTLDAVFYERADSTHFPIGTYVEYIALALEHENDPGGSCAEMNKLQLFNCPLKVLITYPTSRGKGGSTELLAEYADIIARGDIFSDISTLRRQLVIFGWAGPTWEAYMYREGRFERLAA